MSALERLSALLAQEGGQLAAEVADKPVAASDPGLGARAAAGPRTASREEDYELLVEAIHEGYLLHYGSGRVMRPSDPDLALLAGDRLYALGLSKLAELGDLEGIDVLASVISECAQAHAEGRGADTEMIWRRGADAVAHGRAGEAVGESSGERAA